jgi:2-polyprenyl-3-methyl-5-hydroxy-6-metoxy-1,4-benzoquinol methylase
MSHSNGGLLKKPFYLDGVLYDAMHAGVTHDTDFYVEESVRCGGRVLELACGTGRLTLAIAAKGVEIVGLDIEAAMLSEARAKSKALGLGGDWVQADIRDYDLGLKFKLIFIPFNSLLHLHDPQSYKDFFACAKRHLLPDGRLIIDVYNPSVAMLAAPPERKLVMEFVDPETKEKAKIEELRDYDALSQVNRVTWFCSSATRKDHLVHDLHLRCLYPQELRQMVEMNGFEVEKAYGSHLRDPMVSSSRFQILVLKLAAH